MTTYSALFPVRSIDPVSAKNIRTLHRMHGCTDAHFETAHYIFRAGPTSRCQPFRYSTTHLRNLHYSETIIHRNSLSKRTCRCQFHRHRDQLYHFIYIIYTVSRFQKREKMQDLLRRITRIVHRIRNEILFANEHRDFRTIKNITIS
mgnify:CR=1 FL=1